MTTTLMLTDVLQRRRTRDLLRTAPDLVAHLMDQVPPSMQLREPDGSKATAAATAPMPLQTDALEAADRAYAQLADWCIGIAADFHELPPVHLLPYRSAQTDVPRLHRAAWAEPAAARAYVEEVASWLVDRLDRIAESRVGGVFQMDLLEILGRPRLRWPMGDMLAASGWRVEPHCPVCDEQAVRVISSSDGSQFMPLCDRCGWPGTAEELSEEEAAPFLAAAADAG